ncbi:hypothetical protein U737_00655 [Methylomonas sp. LW13]|nr:hypothetical protein CWO84_16050 [Methylomonas sp. Kb3]QBC25534.1 hypothetical protein U737_00655 [Methylomonas sp. LW13]
MRVFCSLRDDAEPAICGLVVEQGNRSFWERRDKPLGDVSGSGNVFKVIPISDELSSNGATPEYVGDGQEPAAPEN